MTHSNSWSRGGREGLAIYSSICSSWLLLMLYFNHIFAHADHIPIVVYVHTGHVDEICMVWPSARSWISL
jgi:hypothetical protein